MKVTSLLAPISLALVLSLAACSYIPRPLGYTGGEPTQARIQGDYSGSDHNPTFKVIFNDDSGKQVARYHISKLGYDYQDFDNMTYSNGVVRFDVMNFGRKVGSVTVDAKRGVIGKTP